MVVWPHCFESVAEESMVEESVHCMVSRKERGEGGREERVPIFLSGSCPQ